MANTPNMNLPSPIPGVTPGQDYADQNQACFTLIDSHNHSSGQGVQINPDGININTDFPMNNQNVISIKSLRLQDQLSSLVGVSDIGCLYRVSDDLYFNDGAGTPIQITANGAVSGTPGSIANLVSPASAAYVAGTSTFVWQSAVNTPANMDGASFTFRKTTASSFGITVSVPSGIASNYSIVWPALPAQTNVVTLDSSGNLASITYDAVGQAMTSTGANAIGATMNSTGANAVAASRTRSTGVTVSAGGVAISDTCGVFVTTNATPQDVTDLEVTITTNGRPVVLLLVSDGSTSASSVSVYASGGSKASVEGVVNFLRGSTNIGINTIRLDATSGQIGIDYPPGSFYAIDAVAAGTYTYKVQTYRISTNTSINFGYIKLVAYEL